MDLPSPADIPMLWNVVQPTLTPVLPDPAIATGTGVLVIPGRAYIMLAMGHEGFDVAEWLADRGVAAFVLKYRVMETANSDDDRMQALVGAAEVRGLSGILRRMDEFASIPLADGEAACSSSVTEPRSGASAPSASAPSGSPPEPAWSSIWPRTRRAPSEPPSRERSAGPAERPVPADAPPLFAAVAADDPFVDGLIQTQAVWRAAGRSVEAHLYARGGHGFGMRRQGLPADQWIEQFHAWMGSEGFSG